MNIKQKREDTKLTIFVDGDIDTTTAPVFMDFIQKELVGVKELIIDLEKVSYISSAGLRVILCAQKTMTTQGSMIVCHVDANIMETFELTGFTEIITII